MKPDRYIEYNNKYHPVFVVNIIDKGDDESAKNMKTIEISVSVESLEKLLLDSSGTPVNDVARSVDEEIFFYIPDELAERDACEIADFVSNYCW